MLLVNFHAGPGTGKSTTAAHLFALAKHRGLKAELITEFAKELCYEKNPIIEDQFFILAEMNRRFMRLKGQVDLAITDCPLTFGIVYGRGHHRKPWFHDAVHGLRSLYDNFDVFLERVKPYQEYGRYQPEVEARMFDNIIHRSLPRFDIELPADEDAAAKLLPIVEAELQKRKGGRA